MAKYSSDSDSERSSSKYRRRRRSSSVDSSDSSPSHQRRSKYSKGKKRYRSRSKSRDKDRGTKSYKHSRGSSRDRRKHRSQKSMSPIDRNKPKKRSVSREKSTSRSSSSQSNTKVLNVDKPSTASRDNFLMNDSKIKASILDDINSDEFFPKQFVSSAKNKESKMKNIVIDINADTIHVPQIANASDTGNSIFHTSIMADKEVRFDKWVKKLHSLRQKAVNELSYI